MDLLGLVRLLAAHATPHARDDSPARFRDRCAAVLAIGPPCSLAEAIARRFHRVIHARIDLILDRAVFVPATCHDRSSITAPYLHVDFDARSLVPPLRLLHGPALRPRARPGVDLVPPGDARVRQWPRVSGSPCRNPASPSPSTRAPVRPAFRPSSWARRSPVRRSTVTSEGSARRSTTRRTGRWARSGTRCRPPPWPPARRSCAARGGCRVAGSGPPAVAVFDRSWDSELGIPCVDMSLGDGGSVCDPSNAVQVDDFNYYADHRPRPRRANHPAHQRPELAVTVTGAVARLATVSARWIACTGRQKRK